MASETGYRWWTVRVWAGLASTGVKLGPLTVAWCHWSGQEYLCLHVLNRWCLSDGVFRQILKERQHAR